VVDLNPAWDFQADFFYNTAFVEKMNMKYFVVECWAHRTFGSDLFIGQAMVDLYTCACGPISHELSIKNEVSRMRLRLRLRLVSVCRHSVADGGGICLWCSAKR
jgi:hypothetical protein